LSAYLSLGAKPKRLIGASRYNSASRYIALLLSAIAAFWNESWFKTWRPSRRQPIWNRQSFICLVSGWWSQTLHDLRRGVVQLARRTRDNRSQNDRRNYCDYLRKHAHTVGIHSVQIFMRIISIGRDGFKSQTMMTWLFKQRQNAVVAIAMSRTSKSY